MSRKILIISDNRDKFYGSPLFLSPDHFQISGIRSIGFLGFSGFKAVVIDCASSISALKKVSLGLRDDFESQAFWELLSSAKGPSIYMLVEKQSPASKEMRELGLSYIISSELSKLPASSDGFETNIPNTDSASYIDYNKSKLLTADDVRELYNKGARALPADVKLTSWASEVASTLQMSETGKELLYLLPLDIKSKADLKSLREDLFELSSKHKNLYFVLNGLYLPIFNSEFPSLKGRTVAPSVHWASHGAFTGELSVDMLCDLQCFGAIILNRSPYNKKENLEKLVKLASSKRLNLFSTFTFASGDTCDIIFDKGFKPIRLIHIYDASEKAKIDYATDSAAIVVDKKYLQSTALNKGK